MLERYGIVTRETVLAEGVPGGFSALYGELSNLEMLGTARRGYFVEGLGGAQFALAGAVERLRSLPASTTSTSSSPRPIPRSHTAPACAGRGCPPARTKIPTATAAAGGDRAVSPAPMSSSATASRRSTSNVAARACSASPASTRTASPEASPSSSQAVRARQLPRLGIERIDGRPALGHEAEQALVDAGFDRQPRRLVASP